MQRGKFCKILDQFRSLINYRVFVIPKFLSSFLNSQNKAMIKQAKMCHALFPPLPTNNRRSKCNSQQKNLFEDSRQLKHFEPFLFILFSYRRKKILVQKKMLVMNKKIFGRTQKFSEEKFKIFAKIFKGLRLFGKNENLRNEDLESFLVTKIIVCQFHEYERSCFSKGHRTWLQNG